MDAAQIMRQALGAGRFDADGAPAASRTPSAAAETGAAMGFALQTMADPAQEFQDSLEELTFQFEEKAMKTAGERRLGETRRAGNPFVEAVLMWQKTLPDMPGGAFMERMLRALRQMLLQGQAVGAQTLLRMLGEGSGDPSHQFAMLEAMAEACRPDEEALRACLASARRALTEAKGPEIRAGLNLAEQINAQAKGPEEMQSLRDLYRGEVLGFTTPQACFRSLLAARGPGRLGEALDFLMKGCGLDLQSPSPSQSPEALHRILGDLQCVMVLKTVMDRMTALAGKMASQFGETCLLSGEALAGRILAFTETPFVAAANIAQLVDACGLRQLLAQLYFCTELVGAFRQLSPRLFADDADRFRLEDAAQEHLDGLVARQEAEDEANRRKGGDAA